MMGPTDSCVSSCCNNARKRFMPEIWPCFQWPINCDVEQFDTRLLNCARIYILVPQFTEDESRLLYFKLFDTFAAIVILRLLASASSGLNGTAVELVTLLRRSQRNLLSTDAARMFYMSGQQGLLMLYMDTYQLKMTCLSRHNSK